jgi:hypothetical protein
LLIAITGIFLLLLYYYCYLCSGNVKAAFVACAVILVPTAICFSLRPQLFGYAFLLVTLICLERFRRGRQKALWVLPLVFALWANTHGSFVFGLMVLGTYWAAGSLHFNLSSLESVRWTPQQGRHIGLISLLSVLALNLTPYGTRLLAYPFQMAFSQPVNIANVQEWRPMPFELLPGKMFLGMVLLFLLAQVLWRLTYPLEDFALLLFAIYAACVHRRFILFFALLFAPWLARLLARWAPRYYAERDPYALNFILIVMIAAGMAKFFPSNRELDRVMANGFPKGAVDYLRQHPAPGPLFNEYFWGGYLIQSLAPQQKVFIDGRADVYEDNGVFSDYLLITSLDNRTLSLLHKYGVKACLIDSKSPLAAFLGSLPDWERVYGNNTSVLFFRKERAPGPPGVSAGARPKPATTFGADAAMVSAGGLLADAF